MQQMSLFPVFHFGMKASHHSFIHRAHRSSTPETYFPRAAFSRQPVASLVIWEQTGVRSPRPGGSLKSVNVTLNAANPETNSQHYSKSVTASRGRPPFSHFDHPWRSCLTGVEAVLISFVSNGSLPM